MVADPPQSVIHGGHLYRSFGKGDKQVMALDDVSLEFRRGEMILVMGPSGSGKSTLLAVLSGLLKPDRGRVLALGEDLWQLPAEARKKFRLCHYGFIFQGYHLFPALTARQQMEIVLRWGQGLPSREAGRRVDAMLALLGLQRQRNSRPDELSGGEKQRVAIGRALIKEPAVCFADEPTSALDWERGKQVVELLHQAAHERAAAIVVVAHDPRLLPYADRIFRLQDGRLAPPNPVAEGLLDPEMSRGAGI